MARIHPTAVIAPSARIGPGCEIGPYAVIGPQVTMGPGNVVGAHAVIEGRTTIGAGNRFSQACSIGAGPQVAGWAGEVGRLTLGDANTFREFVTVHGSTDGETLIGDRCLVMATAHIAHDCRLGDEVKMANGATLAGHVEVGDFAWLSGLCAVHQGSRIGTHAFVAGGAIVAQDVPPFCLVQGDRARLVSLNTTGLKRAGFASAEIMALRRAYRVLFRGSGSMAERLAELEPAAGRVAELVSFLRRSERGAITTERRAA
jgi:UDP-N-acetylglucosamine acyltransferase